MFGRPLDGGQVSGGFGLVRRRQPPARADPHHGGAWRPLPGQRGIGSRSSSTSAAGASSQSARILADLDSSGVTRRIVFLESSDEAPGAPLRVGAPPAPPPGDGRIVDGIAAERELLRRAARRRRPGDRHLQPQRARLRAKMDAQFAGDEEPQLRATVMSFGFGTASRSTPTWSWTCASCPTRTGAGAAAVHRPERGGVLVRPQPARGQEFLDRYTELLQMIAAGYRREGKRLRDRRRRLHRRQAPVRGHVGELAARLVAEGVETVVVHRDMGRE